MTSAAHGHSVDVLAARIEAWLEGFVRRNGELVTAARDGDRVVLTTDRGGIARLTVDLAVEGLVPAAVVAALVAAVRRPRRVAVVLVRRGGYAVGDATTGASTELHASKNGSRYVQGRTAAGGQSQQRFARRRANQADALVLAAADAGVEVLGIRARPVDLLVTGGDQALVGQLLADPRLAWLAGLDRRDVEVADPRKRTLTEAALKGTSVRVEVTNAP